METGRRIPTVKHKRPTSAPRPVRLNDVAEVKTSVETALPAPADNLAGPNFAVLDVAPAPTACQRALYIWIAIIAACVAWQPLLLGFYLDDWAEWVNGASQGKPFSLARLAFANSVDPTRPGLLPFTFVFSSLFGDHPVLWQGGLLLANFGVAWSIVAASRALTQCSTPAGRAITAAAGLCWLLLPWNGAAGFWLTMLPKDLVIAAEGLLCAVLIRGWAKNQSRAVAAGVLYLWMCLSYEAFYFQWIPLVLIGVVLWTAKRVALRPVISTSIALFAAQGVAGLWNIYTKHTGYLYNKQVIPNWSHLVRDNLLNIVPAVLGSVSEISLEFALCGVIVIAMWLVVYVRSLSEASDRLAGYASASLAGISVLGGLISIVIFSLGDRRVSATGVETRSTSLFSFWIVIAAAILTIFTMERLQRLPRSIFALSLAGFGLCLAAGHVLRAGDWATAWNLQKQYLAEAPISDLKRTEKDAQIIILAPLDVNGAPVFAAYWDVNHAIPWAYPFLRSRLFVVYNHWAGPLKWNGRQLSYPDLPIGAADSVYFWRPSDVSFWRPAGPFVINQDLTVDPLP